MFVIWNSHGSDPEALVGDKWAAHVCTEVWAAGDHRVAVEASVCQQVLYHDHLVLVGG